MAQRTQSNSGTASLQPPQNIDAEIQVLGAIMKDADAIHKVIEGLSDEKYFYSPKHRMIFLAVMELYNKNEPSDITTVANQLERRSMLSGIGGRVYLVDLVEAVVSSSNVVKHADIIIEKWVMRSLISTATQISDDCYQGEAPVDDLVDKAETTIFEIAESRLRQGFAHIGETLGLVTDQIENPDAQKKAVKSGFHDIDEKTDGLRNGDFIVIAGRPSMGKTALALNMAESVAIERGVGVGVFSIEMSKEQLVSRMLCGRAGVSQQKLRAQTLSEPEKRSLLMKAHAISKAEIFIDDSPLLTSLEMRAKARRLKANNQNIGLIIVDYIQLMHSTGRVENRQQEIATISRGMKALAKELDLPVIAISQLSRQVEQRGGDKRPQLADLRESGAIEQDADVVMFVYRPEFYFSHLDRHDPKFMEVEGKADIIIAKQRNGPTGVVHLSFRKELARFGNLERGRRDLPAGVTEVKPEEEDGGPSGPMPF
ncbi:MAG: replicative DNA helicase [candidate division Zixibacteria bacterium]